MVCCQFLFSVVIRSYIAGMRDQLKEYKAKAEHGEHAHYHGDELCTSDHGKTPLLYNRFDVSFIQSLPSSGYFGV